MKRVDWRQLDESQKREALARPEAAATAGLASDVARMLAQVRADGDSTLRALTRRFDGVELDRIEVQADEFDAAQSSVGLELKQALRDAHRRIEAFHRAGMQADHALETAPGMLCERTARPIGTVGLYVPAGSAPLPSTALMLGVPAALAGCPQRVMCTPPRADSRADALTLVAAAMCGVKRVFKLGGAQAIAAMALGTESVPRCDKLFGPGNAWVTEAKRQVSVLRHGVAIDMLAGPSEVLVVADRHANPEWIAADLLAQAEHGPDSQVLLVTDCATLIEAVERALVAQIAKLPRRETAASALQHSRAVRVSDIAEAIAVSNAYAPEHLLLQVTDAREFLPQVTNAGSVFIGAWTPESLGDYASGTNHVLPTDGWARSVGGLSVASFQRQMTVQTATAGGLAALAPCVVALARAEGLDAHARAVELRLESPAGLAA
ncbi:MAG: histidinol dehydrogenase [Lysobacterales bacterium]